jgi:hypothetical protein
MFANVVAFGQDALRVLAECGGAFASMGHTSLQDVMR